MGGGDTSYQSVPVCLWDIDWLNDVMGMVLCSLKTNIFCIY